MGTNNEFITKEDLNSILTAIESHIERLEKLYEFSNNEEETNAIELELDYYDELEQKIRNRKVGF
jgi:hypothetical protein